MVDHHELSKLDVARRLLGTALWLYLDDLDPVSVHLLAGAGSELAEQLARDVGATPFIEHALLANPGMTARRYYEIARIHYNAFKHLTTKKGERRNDEELLRDFADFHNDALLFVAWTDLIAASPSTPIEAQVFQVWFYASHPEKLARQDDADRFLAVFPQLRASTRPERKAELRSQIIKARANAAVMGDPRTDKRPLVMAP